MHPWEKLILPLAEAVSGPYFMSLDTAIVLFLFMSMFPREIVSQESCWHSDSYNRISTSSVMFPEL